MISGLKLLSNTFPILLLDSPLLLEMTEEELMREDEDFSKAMLLLDSLTALEEEFAKATLLLDPSLSLEDEFNESALLLDSSMTLMSEDEELRATEEEDFVESMLLLDSSPQRITPLAQQVAQSRISLSLGVTGEERPSSSQAARRSKLEIAKAIILFDFFNAT